MKEFKIRCSAISLIMTEPQGKPSAEKIDKLETELQTRIEKYSSLNATQLKSPSGIKSKEMIERLTNEINDLKGKADSVNLSTTCKSYLKQWFKEQLFRKSVDIKASQIEKGLHAECDAIQVAARFFNWGPVEKNLVRFEDDPYIEGEPDVIRPDEVAEFKCPINQNTFPILAEDIEKKCFEYGYYEQAQGYMYLTGKDKARIIYVLCDPPEEWVDREAEKRARDQGLYEVPAELYKDVENELNYSQYPDRLRISFRCFERNDEFIERVKARVEECRIYIKEELEPLYSEYL